MNKIFIPFQVCQYIGEICRYLLNQPKVPEETQHSVWLMFGNGLRPNIWKEFQSRFKIKCIVEMYGATEGNANLGNCLLMFHILFIF